MQILLISQIIKVFVNILAISLMIKVFSVEDFGVLSIGLMLFSFALMFELQTSQSLQIFVPGYIKKKQYMSVNNMLITSYALRQSVYPIISLTLFLFSNLLSNFYNINIEVIWIICCGVLIRVLASPFDFGNLFAFNKITEISIQNFIETIAIALIIYITAKNNINLNLFLIMWIMRLLPVFIFSWIIYIKSSYVPSKNLKLNTVYVLIKKIVKISFSTFQLTIIGKLSQTLPLLISGGYFSLVNIAYFNYTTSLIRQFWGLVSYLESMFLSSASGKLNYEERRLSLNKNFFLLLFIASLSISFLIIFFKEITLILGKGDYLNSKIFFNIQVVAIFFYSFEVMRFNLYINNKMSTVVTYALIKLIIEFPFCILAIYFENIILLCYGFVIGPLLFGLLLFVSQSNIDNKKSTVFIIFEFFKNLNFFIIYMLLVYFIDEINENLLAKILIFIILSFFMYLQYIKKLENTK